MTLAAGRSPSPTGGEGLSQGPHTTRAPKPTHRERSCSPPSDWMETPQVETPPVRPTPSRGDTSGWPAQQPSKPRKDSPLIVHARMPGLCRPDSVLKGVRSVTLTFGKGRSHAEGVFGPGRPPCRVDSRPKCQRYRSDPFASTTFHLPCRHPVRCVDPVPTGTRTPWHLRFTSGVGLAGELRRGTDERVEAIRRPRDPRQPRLPSDLKHGDLGAAVESHVKAKAANAWVDVKRPCRGRVPTHFIGPDMLGSHQRSQPWQAHLAAMAVPG